MSLHLWISKYFLTGKCIFSNSCKIMDVVNCAIIRHEILTAETSEEFSWLNNWTGINRELEFSSHHAYTLQHSLTELLAKWLEKNVTSSLGNCSIKASTWRAFGLIFFPPIPHYYDFNWKQLFVHVKLAWGPLLKDSDVFVSNSACFKLLRLSLFNWTCWGFWEKETFTISSCVLPSPPANRLTCCLWTEKYPIYE